MIFLSDSELMELQIFSQCPNLFLQLVYDGFGVRILCVIVQPLKPTFLVNEI